SSNERTNRPFRRTVEDRAEAPGRSGGRRSFAQTCPEPLVEERDSRPPDRFRRQKGKLPMTDIVDIPLNKLTQFEGNVRKTQNKGFIDELAASIKAHGLQQNLVVKKEGKQFAVVAGSQRLTALLVLAKAGEIKGTHPVPCKLAEADIDPSEISLLEKD